MLIKDLQPGVMYTNDIADLFVLIAHIYTKDLDKAVVALHIFCKHNG